MLKTTSIASFPLGMDNLSDETSIPGTAARDLRNLDINTAGNFRTRRGFTLLTSMDDAHSLWSPRDQSFGLFVRGAVLHRLVVRDGQTYSAAVSSVMPGRPMSYCEHADEVFFSNGVDLGVVTRTSVRRLGVDVPGAPTLTTVAGGPVPAGKYSLALSLVLPGGEESGLSDITSATLAQDSTVTVSIPSAGGMGTSTVRVYSTSTNGDVLYRVADLPVGLVSYTLSLLNIGKVADNQFLTRMKPGGIVRAYNGRLITARGDEVWFSEPFRYGLTSPRHNFLRFNARVTMVEPVVDGVYVSTQEAVYFLRGDKPGAFTQSLVSANAAFGTGTAVPIGALPKKYADQATGAAVVWLGARGYSLGMPGGTVHDVQQDRLLLPAATGVQGVYWTVDGIQQVISIVESPMPAGPGAAVDSTV